MHAIQSLGRSPFRFAMSNARTETQSPGTGLKSAADEHPAGSARTREAAERSLAAAGARVTGLKPFPAVASQALTILKSDDYVLDALRKTIEGDVALVARLLRVANSAAFRPRHPYNDLGEVLVRLGAGTVGDIVAGVAVLGLFEDSAGHAHRVKHHSVRVGALARDLAKRRAPERASQLFLSGLVHDVGTMLSMQEHEIRYDLLGDDAFNAPDVLHVLEAEAVGYDHAALGAYVLGQWGLSEAICDAVAFHHLATSERVGNPAGAEDVALLRFANVLEYELRGSDPPGEASVETLAASPEAQSLGFDVSSLTELLPDLMRSCADLHATFAR